VKLQGWKVKVKDRGGAWPPLGGKTSGGPECARNAGVPELAREQRIIKGSPGVQTGRGKVRRSLKKSRVNKSSVTLTETSKRERVGQQRRKGGARTKKNCKRRRRVDGRRGSQEQGGGGPDVCLLKGARTEATEWKKPTLSLESSPKDRTKQRTPAM